MSRRAEILLALGCLAAAAGAAEEPAVRERPRVGILLPADPAVAGAMRRGAALAAEAVGADLVVRVPRGTWDTHAAAAVALRFDDGVDALIAPPDRRIAHAAAQLATRARTPLVVLSDADALTRTGVPWIERVGPDERAVLEALLARVPEKARTTVVLDDDDEGRRTGERILAALVRADRPAGRLVTCDGTAASVRAAVERVRTDGGPLLLACRMRSAVRVLEGLETGDAPAVRLAGPSTDAALLAVAAPRAARGVVAPLRFDPVHDAAAGRFAALWRRHHDDTPRWEAWAAYRAVVRAVERVQAGDVDFPASAATHRTIEVRTLRIGRAGRADPPQPCEEAR